MNESVFKEILGDALKCRLAEFDNAPEHKFSLKHKLAMKHIFAKFARNVRKLKKEDKPKNTSKVKCKPMLSIRQRVIVAALIVILMSLLVGWVVVFVSEKFHGTVYHDNTQLFVVDVENCPTTIEYKYAFAAVPDGFEMIETDSSPIDVYMRYKNKQTGQEITLSQLVKIEYKPHFNTENHQIEEMTVNNKAGLYVDFSIGEDSRTLLVWDNGDYILEITADLDKTKTINLAKFNKI